MFKRFFGVIAITLTSLAYSADTTVKTAAPVHDVIHTVSENGVTTPNPNLHISYGFLGIVDRMAARRQARAQAYAAYQGQQDAAIQRSYSQGYYATGGSCNGTQAYAGSCNGSTQMYYTGGGCSSSQVAPPQMYYMLPAAPMTSGGCCGGTQQVQTQTIQYYNPLPVQTQASGGVQMNVQYYLPAPQIQGGTMSLPPQQSQGCCDLQTQVGYYSAAAPKQPKYYVVIRSRR